MNCQLILHSDEEDLIIPLFSYALAEELLVAEGGIKEDARYFEGEIVAVGLEKIQAVQVLLDGATISEQQEEKVGASFRVVSSNGNQPFLLCYEYVRFEVELELPHERKEFASQYYRCFNRKDGDTENLKSIIEELDCVEDKTIISWLKPKTMPAYDMPAERYSFIRGKLTDYTKEKSISTKVKLLKAVLKCYKSNASYFRTQAKHSLVKTPVLQSYEKVRSISRNDICWLVQNGKFVATGGIQTNIKNSQGENLLPLKMRTNEIKKSRDIYENRVVLSFLSYVLTEARALSQNFNVSRNVPAGYSFIMSSFYAGAEEIERLIEPLEEVERQYKQHLSECTKMAWTTRPRLTKIFQEVGPYQSIFQEIKKWHQGEFELKAENMFFRIKLADKLFEYYCLLRLLQMFQRHGFSGSSEFKPFSLKEASSDPKESFENDTSIANIYTFRRDNLTVTLYYQPVIYGGKTEHGITLICTTRGINDIYTPDFLMKIEHSDAKPQYAVFDAKFSNRSSILDQHMNSLLQKYVIEISEQSSFTDHVKMMWILQGRMDDGTIDYTPEVKRFPNTKTFFKGVSYGVASINTDPYRDSMEELWEEVSKCLFGGSRIT